jgi:L-alanine-DL-glutamate epimerase-like enolase superfamily enzyme
VDGHAWLARALPMPIAVGESLHSADPIYLEKHAVALDRYLERLQVVTNGTVRPTDEPGTGLRFDRRSLAKASGAGQPRSAGRVQGIEIRSQSAVD